MLHYSDFSNENISPHNNACNQIVSNGYDATKPYWLISSPKNEN